MKWSAKDIATLKRLYRHDTAEGVAILMGRSVSSIRNQAHLLGLKKSPEWIAAKSRHNATVTGNGKKFGFRKGQKSWNKGMKGWEAGGRSIETRFKKGNTPQTYKPVGTERVNKDGHTEVKVADPNVWKKRQHIVWEQTYGPVPKGKVIRFRDGNIKNVQLSNLVLIDRAENMEQNTVHRYPRELKFAMRVAKRLHREIAKHEERN